ncbi:MAG: zinc-ribbon domain-containing protein [Candidatus Bathyarchaeia archaeon]
MCEEKTSRLKLSRRRLVRKVMTALTFALIFYAMASMIIEPVRLRYTLTYTKVIHTTQKEVYTCSTTVVHKEESRGYYGTFHVCTTITSTYCWTETKWYETWVPGELTETAPPPASTVAVPEELIVHLITDKSEYIVGDHLNGEIWVTDEYANSVEGAQVGITYVFNGRIFGDESAVTDINGEVSLRWQWTQEHVGNWEIIVSASKEGYASASDKIKVSVYSTEPVPKEQLTITIQTDRRIYEQGEAVTVSGQVRYNNKLTPPKDRKVIIEVLQVPNRKYTQPYNMFDWHTDESGHYSVMPFAGWEIGEYVIRAKCSLDAEKEKITAESEPWSFYVEKATLVKDMRDQVRKITELYQDPDLGVPEGPLRRAIIRKDELYKPPKIVEWGLIPESSYGSYTNLLHLTTRDPKIKELLGPYTCGGCQAQTLKFMDHIRFHKDPEVRRLMKGLDYGPISRGFPSPLIIGSHHAVVLYPISTDWRWPPEYAGQFAKVFDPWPTQKPEVYYVEQFERPYGLSRVSELYQSMYDSNNLFSGYPLTGGAIYVNYEVVGKRSTPPREEASNAVLVDCPVDILITDSEGKRAGMLPDGILMQEFPAYIYQGVENEEITSWYFELPKGTYTIEIIGRSAGTFKLLIGGEAVGNQILKYGEQEILEGGTAKVTIGASDKSPPLSLPNGKTVNPGSFKEPEPKTFSIKLGALIIAVLLIIVVSFLVKRSHLKQKPKAVLTQPRQAMYQSREKTSEGATFCEECGKRIPANSTFCPYCGDKQGVK